MNKRGGSNKRGGWTNLKIMINVEGRFLCGGWDKFCEKNKRGSTFIRQERVLQPPVQSTIYSVARNGRKQPKWSFWGKFWSALFAKGRRSFLPPKLVVFGFCPFLGFFSHF